MPKHVVEVTLTAERTIHMEVEAEDGDDPADLTPEERYAAVEKAQEAGPVEWTVESAREVE